MLWKGNHGVGWINESTIDPFKCLYIILLFFIKFPWFIFLFSYMSIDISCLINLSWGKSSNSCHCCGGREILRKDSITENLDNKKILVSLSPFENSSCFEAHLRFCHCYWILKWKIMQVYCQCKFNSKRYGGKVSLPEEFSSPESLFFLWRHRKKKECEESVSSLSSCFSVLYLIKFFNSKMIFYTKKMNFIWKFLHRSLFPKKKFLFTIVEGAFLFLYTESHPRKLHHTILINQRITFWFPSVTLFLLFSEFLESVGDTE